MPASVKGAHLNLHRVQSPRGITAPESGRGAADGTGRNNYYYRARARGRRLGDRAQGSHARARLSVSRPWSCPSWLCPASHLHCTVHGPRRARRSRGL
jgi:hypothetical protein